MRSRLPLVLSTTALIVAVLGTTPLGEAAGRAMAKVPPFAKRADYANRAGTAANAKKLGGRKASAYARLDARGKLPLSVLAGVPSGQAGAKGDPGPKGDQGDKGEKGDRGPGGLVAAYTKTAGGDTFKPLAPGNNKLVTLALPGRALRDHGAGDDRPQHQRERRTALRWLSSDGGPRRGDRRRRRREGSGPDLRHRLDGARPRVRVCRRRGVRLQRRPVRREQLVERPDHGAPGRQHAKAAARRRRVGWSRKRCRELGRRLAAIPRRASQRTPRPAASRLSTRPREGPTRAWIHEVAPGGIEPPHADSKSAALSTELRGLGAPTARMP